MYTLGFLGLLYKSKIWPQTDKYRLKEENLIFKNDLINLLFPFVVSQLSTVYSVVAKTDNIRYDFEFTGTFPVISFVILKWIGKINLQYENYLRGINANYFMHMVPSSDQSICFCKTN